MAGSLNHLVGEDGKFSMDLIENMGDAHEALEECYNIIILFDRSDPDLLSKICEFLKYSTPERKLRRSIEELGDIHGPRGTFNRW